MPTYEYQCPACGGFFDEFLPMSRSDEPQNCPECGTAAKKLISLPSFILSGDDWPGKAHKINRQMAEKNRRLDAKQEAKRRDAPVATLAPNVDGERVDSWSEAQKLAASKGKDASSYDSKVRAEQAAKK